jgi:septum formation inhibitor-activating ATPase MinD
LHFDNAEIEQKPVEAVEEKEVARRGIFGSKKVEDKKTEEKQETVIKTEENTTNKTSQENTDNIQTNTQDRTQDKTQADRSNVENNTLKGNSQLNEVKKQPVQNESATYIGGQIEVTTKTYKKKGIVFTEATENDFADFTQHNLPSPENFDGNHRRKEILYGDSNQSFSAPTKEQGVGAKIGVFAGVRQGVGCTSTAIDVAVALAKKDNKVLLLDFAGSIFKKLGIKGEWNGLETLTYWLNNGYNITNQTVTMNTLLKNERNQTGLPDKEINFSYMPKSLHFLETRLDTLGDITNVIRVLKTQYDYIIADVDLGYDLPPVRTLLSLADSVFCVTTQDMYEVNMLTECINSYKNTVNFANKARIIVNRYQKAELDVNYLKEIVQTDIVIGLNEDSANHLRASNSCMPYYLTTRKRKYLKNYELIINAI